MNRKASFGLILTVILVGLLLSTLNDAETGSINFNEGTGPIGSSTKAYSTQSSSASSTPPTEWEKLYGGSGDEKAYSVVQTSDGGYAITGCSSGSAAFAADFYLVKTVPESNLRAVSIEPVQIVWGVNLVQDKATDFRISYESTFNVDIETDILLESPSFIPNTYQFKYKFKPGINNFIIGSENRSSPFFIAHIKPNATFKFTIDPGNLSGRPTKTTTHFLAQILKKRQLRIPVN